MIVKDKATVLDIDRTSGSDIYDMHLSTPSGYFTIFIELDTNFRFKSEVLSDDWIFSIRSGGLGQQNITKEDLEPFIGRIFSKKYRKPLNISNIDIIRCSEYNRLQLGSKYKITIIADDVTNSYLVADKVHDYVIPSEYQAVEYLKSTGTQYIDTLISINSLTNVKYELDINLTELDARDGFIGVESYWYNGLACHNLYDGFIFANENRPLVKLNYGPLSTGTRYRVIVDKDSITVNGVSGIEQYDTNLSFEGRNIHIPNKPSAGHRSLSKYYMCKISIDSILTRYLIPVIRKSDSKPGMYDTVSQTFFTNQGTGEFLYGSPVDNYKLMEEMN